MARSVELGKGSKFVVLASVCIVVAALSLAREVLIPLALAVLITFLLTPAVRRLEKWRLPRVPSVLIVVVLGLAAVGAVGWIVEQQFEQVADELIRNKPQIRAKLARLTGSGTEDGLGGAMRKLGSMGEAMIPDGAEKSPETLPSSQPATTTRRAWFDVFTIASTLGTQRAPQTVISPPAGSVVVVPPPAPAKSGAPAKPGASSVTPGPTVVATPGKQYTADEPLPVRDFPSPQSPVKRVAEYLGMALNPLATAGIVIIFVVFMLLNREDLRDRMLRLVGHGRLNLTTQAIDDAGQRISRYLVAQSLINAAYGILVAGGLWLNGRLLGARAHVFPSVLLWGLIAGLFRFIPYIGPWIGAAGPLVVAFGFFPGNGVFFGVIGLFFVLELIVSQVAEPLIYGSSTGMSTLAVLVAAVFWAWLWGPIGLLLSTPLTVVLVVMGKYVPQLEFLGVMLGDEPVLEPPVRVYQRLLAFDQEEAGELVRGFLKDRPLLEVYDEVLLPVLAMAEQDQRKGQLDENRSRFILQAMRSIVDELGDDEAAAAAERDASIPRGCKVNVVCLPAHDEADEVAGLMLGQLLEQRGYCAFSLTQAALASEMVEAVGEREADVVVVSALPPAAVTHSRYLCKRLHGRYGDDMNMLVGLWLENGDLEKAKSRIACAGAVQLATTFRRALEAIHQMAQPAILAAKQESDGVSETGNRKQETVTK